MTYEEERLLKHELYASVGIGVEHDPNVKHIEDDHGRCRSFHWDGGHWREFTYANTGSTRLYYNTDSTMLDVRRGLAFVPSSGNQPPD